MGQKLLRDVHLRRLPKYTMQQSLLHTMLGTSWADSPLYFCNRKSAITLKKELDCRDGCGYASEINGVPAATEAKRWIAKAEAMTGVRVIDRETDADPLTASDSGTTKARTASVHSQS